MAVDSWNRFSNKRGNQLGFRPLLCTYRLNWAKRISWGWWDDTDVQTQDSKFKPWRSEAEHATSRSHLSPKHTNERDSGAKIIKPTICSWPKHSSAKASVKGNAIIFRRHFFCVSRRVFVPEKSKQMNLALEQGQTSHILRLIFGAGVPVNAKHLYSICTMLDQRRRRWANVVQILYKCFVFYYWITLSSL